MPDDPTLTDKAAEAGTARHSAIARALEARFRGLLDPLDPSLLAAARRIVVAVVGAAAHEAAELLPYATLVDDWDAGAAADADCPRRFKSEPPCRLNIEPGMEADVETVGCG